MRPVLTLALKDLKVLFRVRSALFFAIGWPICMAILFGLMFGGSGQPRKLPVAVVDEDGTAMSREFVEQMVKREGMEVSRADRATATDLVRHGRRVAAVIVPAGYGAASERPPFAGTPPTLELLADPSRKAEGAMLEGLLFGLSAERLQRMPSGVETPPAASAQGKTASTTAPVAASGWKPVEIVRQDITADRDGPRSGFDVSFVQGLVWGLIGCAMTFAISLVAERTHGTLIRLRMAPLSAAQVLGGKAAACFLALLLMQSVLLGLGVFVFKVGVSSPLALIVSMICAAAAFVGVMMLVASLGSNEQATSGAGWAMLMPMSLFGGGMVPLFVMPAWMAPFSNFSIVKWAVLGFEGAIWRGFAPADFLLPWGILLAVGAAGFLLGARNLRRTAV